MAKKITKAQWDACLNDDVAWEGKCVDETLFRVNGADTIEIDPSLDPKTIIHIEEGIVASHELEYIKPLTSFITAWQKKQTVRSVAIEIPQGMDDKTLRAHLKTFGAKLL